MINKSFEAFYQAAEVEKARLNLTQAGLNGLFGSEDIARKAERIVRADHEGASSEKNFGQSAVQPANQSDVFHKAALRAINFEIFEQLRQTQNTVLLNWLRDILMKGLYRICSDPEEVEEAVQAGMPAILENLAGVKNPEAFLFWALQVVRNKLTAHYRSETKSVKIGERLAVERDWVAPDPEKTFLLRELREIFLQHINSLRPTKNTEVQQHILLAVYFRGESIEQIACELGLKNQRVSHLLDEAHNRLRKDHVLLKKLADWKDERAGPAVSNFSP